MLGHSASPKNAIKSKNPSKHSPVNRGLTVFLFINPIKQVPKEKIYLFISLGYSPQADVAVISSTMGLEALGHPSLGGILYSTVPLEHRQLKVIDMTA